MRKVLVPAENYDLEKTLKSGQLFRFRPYRDGFLVQSTDRYCYIAQEDENVLALHVPLHADVPYWENFFGVYDNYESLEEVMSQNKFLRKVYEYSKGVHILRQDPFEALVCFIISQQNNIPRIMKCVEAICASAGKPIGEGLYAFPTPDQIRPPVLENCGLGYRKNYIYNIAYLVSNRFLRLEDLTADKTSSQHAIQELTREDGIGIKVASCAAIYGLGHRDRFPIDVWIGRAMEEGNITPEMIEGFGNYAAIVQQYIYYYMLHRKDV